MFVEVKESGRVIVAGVDDSPVGERRAMQQDLYCLEEHSTDMSEVITDRDQNHSLRAKSE
jgi:hypothetical protein